MKQVVLWSCTKSYTSSSFGCLVSHHSDNGAFQDILDHICLVSTISVHAGCQWGDWMGNVALLAWTSLFKGWHPKSFPLYQTKASPEVNRQITLYLRVERMPCFLSGQLNLLKISTPVFKMLLLNNSAAFIVSKGAKNKVLFRTILGM